MMKSKPNLTGSRAEAGVSAISYALLVGGIAISAILGLRSLGTSADQTFTEAGNKIDVVRSAHTSDSTDAVESDDGAGSSDDGSGSSDDGAGNSDDGAGNPDDGAGNSDDGGAGNSDDGGAGNSDDGAGNSDDGAGNADDGGPGNTDDGAGNSDDGAGNADDGAGNSDEAGEPEPDQSATTGVFGQFAVTFEETDGTVSVGAVSSGAWIHEVIKDTGTRIEVEFTQPGSWKKYVVKGYLDRHGTLKTKVQKH